MQIQSQTKCFVVDIKINVIKCDRHSRKLQMLDLADFCASCPSRQNIKGFFGSSKDQDGTFHLLAKV